MQAIKILDVVKKDGEIKMTGLPIKKGQRVELIVMTHLGVESSGLSAQNLLKSKIVGLWKDRLINDSAVFARKLREEAQNRGN
jgi:hypothetical protein